jgi:hypothetical protein
MVSCFVWLDECCCAEQLCLVSNVAGIWHASGGQQRQQHLTPFANDPIRHGARPPLH